MDKQQAQAASEAVMLQAQADQARRREQLQTKPQLIKPWWRVLGLGLVGCGVGISSGYEAGNGLLYGVVGLIIGVAAATVITRRRS